MNLLKIIDLDNGFRLFRWQYEVGGCMFVEWKREQTILEEICWEETLNETREDWELDADMMIEVLSRYKDRGVEKVDWECRCVFNNIDEVIVELKHELECGWDVWVEDDFEEREKGFSDD